MICLQGKAGVTGQCLTGSQRPPVTLTDQTSLQNVEPLRFKCTAKSEIDCGEDASRDGSNNYAQSHRLKSLQRFGDTLPVQEQQLRFSLDKEKSYNVVPKRK